jgi:Streptomyces sporulation and cell division protein, SsgA
MSTRHGGISAELVIQLVEPNELSVPMAATLRYEPDDPFAITAEFHTDHATVTWRFARELLREGAEAPAGQGDVQIWPERLGAGPVSLKVTTQGGQALFTLPRRGVQAFLARTYAAVPAGTESQHFDAEALLAALTGDAA